MQKKSRTWREIMFCYFLLTTHKCNLQLRNESTLFPYRSRTFFLYWLGVTPKCCLNTRIRWLWSVKHSSEAISLVGISVCISNSCAFASRSRVIKSKMRIPVSARKKRERELRFMPHERVKSSIEIFLNRFCLINAIALFVLSLYFAFAEPVRCSSISFCSASIR